MADIMTFPDTVEEFMEEYKLVDTEQVYTNGTELVPIFRMKQWFEHEKAQLSCEGTTSDTISKTETVEHLRRVLEATVPNTDYDEGFIDGVEFGISTVSTMPTIQPEPKWIPVERELPEENGRVLICGVKGGIYIARKGTLFGKPTFWAQGNRLIDTTAWMPLPEPYKSNNE